MNKEIFIFLFLHIFVSIRPKDLLTDTAWDLSREHWWDLVIFESILFLESLIECLLQIESWARCLGGRIFFSVTEETYILFYFSKRVSLCSRYEFFYYTFTYFVTIEVIEVRVTKINLFCLYLDQFYFYMLQSIGLWLFEKFIFKLDSSSYSFKRTCILLKLVISLEKMAVSSAKFTSLIS